MHADTHGLEKSRWSKSVSWAIEALCFVMLMATAGTVIYGFSIRAIWAEGYYLAVALAAGGTLVMLVGIAQQAIAARDAATWREMAEWQIRAARDRLAQERARTAQSAVVYDGADTESPAYYEHLMSALVDHAVRTEEEAMAGER